AAYTAQLLLVAAAIGQPVDPFAAWGALGLGIIVGVLSLLPFGLGSADLVVAGLLVVAGVPGREAVAITFGYRIVSTLPLGLLGVASYALLSARLPHGHASEAASEASAALGGAADVEPKVTR
ncbi:MAG: lysylphosphatidylglycerol synthase domain-containing protein, partial [Chloroflexota bacterium]